MMLNIEIADWSGSIWLVAFYDLCEILLQKSIEELVKLYQDNIRCYRKLLIQKLLYHTFNFRIKSRRELYEGEYRIRHILESVLPDDDDKSIHETYIKSIKFLNENV
ncbi:Replication factor A protein 1 [Dermatophagoides farinae]|nr:Replication factor A protein 1 [Dermatophagoides farinae]